MRISKFSSGAQGVSGRGEYEIAEPALDAHHPGNYLKPSDLVECSIRLQIGDIIFDTDARLTHEQGKYRLRLNQPNQRYLQIPIQITRALLMPPQVRGEQLMGGGEPVLRNESYILKNVQFGQVWYEPPNRFFRAEVTVLDCANRTNEAEQVKVPERISAVERLWKLRERLPENIARLLERHEDAVRSGGPLTQEVGRIVLDLQQETARVSSEFAVPYADRTDVVPTLLSMLDDTLDTTLDHPLALESLDPEQPDIRRREIQRWQAWVRRRGAPSKKFARQVREAYHMRCLMCGSHFPATDYNSNPGVDAAHILPWAAYDLDEVYNGVALCKLHHWAFDERILLISSIDGGYEIILAPEAEPALSQAGVSLDTLRQVVGVVPRDRLPAHEQDWPRPDLLERWMSEGAS